MHKLILATLLTSLAVAGWDNACTTERRYAPVQVLWTP